MATFSRLFASVVLASVATLLSSTSVLFANELPQLELSSRQVNLGSIVQFTVAPTDQDGVVPGVNILKAPTGAELIDNLDGTRNFRWTPTKVGKHTVIFSVTDGQYSNVKITAKMSINVLAEETQLELESPVPSLSPPPPVSRVPGRAMNSISNSLPTFDTATNSISTTPSLATTNTTIPASVISQQQSKRRVWNSDETLLDLEYNIVNAEDFSIFLSSVPLSTGRVWSQIDPSRVIGFAYDDKNDKNANKLVSFDINDLSAENIFHFSQYDSCTLGEWEGDISLDDRYALVTCLGDDSSTLTAISLDMQTQTILGSLNLDATYHWGGFSQSGAYVLIEFGQATSAKRRLVRYSPTLKSPIVLSDYYASDRPVLGLDSRGLDVLAINNTNKSRSQYYLNDGSLVDRFSVF